MGGAKRKNNTHHKTAPVIVPSTRKRPIRDSQDIRLPVGAFLGAFFGAFGDAFLRFVAGFCDFAGGLLTQGHRAGLV
ncbi:MAG: hypothetical protein ACJAU6_003083 [Alphaproteobacteria bacterium]|jgi:hypothetical protein